jgi:hypothetical protein
MTHGVPHNPPPLCVLVGGTWAPLVQVIEKVLLILLDG